MSTRIQFSWAHTIYVKSFTFVEFLFSDSSVRNPNNINTLPFPLCKVEPTKPFYFFVPYQFTGYYFEAQMFMNDRNTDNKKAEWLIAQLMKLCLCSRG